MCLPPVQLPAPKSVNASIRKSPTEVDVSWERLSNEKDLDVLGYKVVFKAIEQKGRTVRETSTHVAKLDKTNFTILKELTPFTTYSIMVVAFTRRKEGDYSDATNGGKCGTYNVRDSDLESHAATRARESISKPFRRVKKWMRRTSLVLLGEFGRSQKSYILCTDGDGSISIG